MNRIIALLIGLAAVSGPVTAQDAALVERVNRLSAYVDELLADKARQQKQITDLTREVQNLREELERAKGGVTRDDVAAVADAVKRLDQKHRADIKLVVEQLKGLAKTPVRPTAESSSEYPHGFEYTIQSGNTLSAIAQAYRDQGVRVTVDDILRANPGLDPKRLRVGQVIIIPEP